MEHFNYYIVFILMMAGLYLAIANDNLVKKVLGLSIFQTAVFLLFISMGKVKNATAPIAAEGFDSFSNPLTHVLILTAIVVSIATTSVALALVVRIKEAYGTIEEDELVEKERSQ